MPDSPGSSPITQVLARSVASTRNDVSEGARFTIAPIVAVRYDMTGTHEGEFQGIAPSGTEVGAQGMNFFRLEDGKLAEKWSDKDVLGFLQQLGVIPTPEAV